MSQMIFRAKLMSVVVVWMVPVAAAAAAVYFFRDTLRNVFPF
jgi:hypothetical protein